MTEAEALEWAGTPEGAEQVLAIVRRWKALGYEPQISVTRQGDLALQVSLPLGEWEEEDEQDADGSPGAGD